MRNCEQETHSQAMTGQCSQHQSTDYPHKRLRFSGGDANAVVNPTKDLLALIDNPYNNDLKVSVWNLDINSYVGSVGHSSIVTDVRFKPRSTVFVVSSVDTTIQLWDGAEVTRAPNLLVGHTKKVMSVDFNPVNVNTVCSCDCEGEFRLWNVDGFKCRRVFKLVGASSQVRYRCNNVVAGVIGKRIELIHFTRNINTGLKGHTTDVLAVCCHPVLPYVASVSEDAARIWQNFDCKHELSSGGKKFRSCVFHPTRALTLIIGTDESFELWNCVGEGSVVTLEGFTSTVSALACAPTAGLIASASPDSGVRLWKVGE